LPLIALRPVPFGDDKGVVIAVRSEGVDDKQETSVGFHPAAKQVADVGLRGDAILTEAHPTFGGSVADVLAESASPFRSGVQIENSFAAFLLMDFSDPTVGDTIFIGVAV